MITIVGMNDPSGKGPLLNSDPGSAGTRLWQMSGMSKEEWEKKTTRVNLLPSRKWIKSYKDAAAASFLIGPLAEGHVIFLGREVEAVIRKHRRLWPKDYRFYFIPHPSGRCRYYNSKENRDRVRNLIKGLMS